MKQIAAGLMVAWLGATSVKADSTAVPTLTAFANYVAGACQSSQCPSLKITTSTLYLNDHARYCVVTFDAHDSGASSGAPPPGPGAQQGPVPVPTTLGGTSIQYRSENSWTLAQAIAAAGAPPPPPRLSIAGPFPFSPFSAPQCDVKINVQAGSLTIGSISGGNEPVASFDIKLLGPMLVGLQTTTSNGGGGVSTIVIEKTTTPFFVSIR